MEKEILSPSEKLNKLKEVLFAHRKADKDEGEKEVVAQGGSNKNPEIQDGPKQELEAGEKKLISEDVAAASKVPFKKKYYQGNYSGAAKHIEKKYGSKVLNHPKVKDALRQANESKMATKDHDGDGKVETSTAEYKGSKDKAIKNALAKRKDANDKAMKTGFMKMPGYVRQKFDESSWDGGDPSDAPSKADLEKERSARLKKMKKNIEKTVTGMQESSASWKATQEAEKMARLSKGEQQKISQIRSMLDKERKAKQQSEENIQEISDKMKVNYIKKAKEQITDREKHGTSSVDKDQILKRRIGIRTATGKLGEEKGRGPTGISYSVTPGHPDAENPKTGKKFPERQTAEYKANWRKKSKPGLGQHTGMKNPMKEDNIQEISTDLAKNVTKQRKLNVTKTMMKADGDHRDPDYAKAKQKLKKNQSLNFSRGARMISKAFDGKRLGESIRRSSDSGTKPGEYIGTSGVKMSKHKIKAKFGKPQPITGKPKAAEKLQEISDALKKRYIAKANKQITSKEKMKDYQLSTMDKQNDKPKSLPREKFTKADKEFVKNKYDKEINKRRVGVRTARSKLGEDNIQEISKNLASRYIKRAVGDAISNADKTQYHVSKSMQKKAAHKHADTPAKKGKLTKGANKHFATSRDSSRKTMNRFYGIQRAAGKLNKSDKDKGEYLGHSMTKQKTSSKIKATEEMVNELRKSTLSNYIKKAGKQYDDGENALHKGYPEKPIYKMQDKRAKGMAMAGKKLAKKITTSEEIQQRLDELKKRLDPKCWDGYKKQGTKKKGDTIVNNCVKESSAAKAAADARRDMKRDSKGLASTKKDTQKAYNPSKDKSPPHIISQLQKAVSLGDKHDGVKFKDGKTHKVSAKHAQGFINKYMGSKPADKERMQSHGHESHKNFKTHL